jgi:hypothetical protein
VRGSKLTVANVTLVVPKGQDKEVNENRMLGQFEFLHLPRVGDDLYLPATFDLEPLKVIAINHSPREFPRVANSEILFADREPSITIWVEETY